MINHLRSAFSAPSAAVLRQKLLETTARDLLAAEAALESALAARDMYAKRLKRLSVEAEIDTKLTLTDN